MGEKPTIAVIGAGLMGHGIAWIFLAGGWPVRLHDPLPEALAAVPEKLGAVAALLEVEEVPLARLTLCSDLAEAVQDADFIFEAAPEKLELKQDLFARLGKLARADALLATNTSALPIAQIAANMADKSRLAGTHFWNPPHLVPLVEVIEMEGVNAGAVVAFMALLDEAGRQPVHVRKDVPGFIGNRLQHALKREAIALVANGICDAETIDTVVKSGFGKRLSVLGPLEQSDLVGLDLTIAIHDSLIPDLDVTPNVHPLLAQKVAEGKLGMKTGEGFRSWTPETAQAVRNRLSAFLAEEARATARSKG